MLLLKAAVNVGSELPASSYSLKTNTECSGRFIFSEFYIFFLLPMDFILRVKMPSDLNSTALLCEQILNS